MSHVRCTADERGHRTLPSKADDSANQREETCGQGGNFRLKEGEKSSRETETTADSSPWLLRKMKWGGGQFEAGLECKHAPGSIFDDSRHADTDKSTVRQLQLENFTLGPQAHIHVAAAATSSFCF